MTRKISAWMIGLLLILQMNGCVAVLGAAAGGAGTMTWLGGKLTERVASPMERTQRATRFALRDLNMVITRETIRDNVIQFIGETEAQRPFWIDITPVSRKESRVDVRVGVPGDKEISAQVMKKILSHL